MPAGMLLIIGNAQTKDIKVIILAKESDELFRELKTITSDLSLMLWSLIL